MKGGAFSAFDSSSTALQIRPTADGFVSYAGLGCMEIYGPGLVTGPRPVSLLIETTSVTPTANLTEAIHEFYYQSGSATYYSRMGYVGLNGAYNQLSD